MQTNGVQRGGEQIGADQRPDGRPLRAGKHAGREQGRRRAVLAVRHPAGDLVQRALGEPAGGKIGVDGGTEGDGGAGAGDWPLHLSDLPSQLVEVSTSAHKVNILGTKRQPRGLWSQLRGVAPSRREFQLGQMVIFTCCSTISGCPLET